VESSGRNLRQPEKLVGSRLMPQSYGNVYIGHVKSGAEADKELQQNELEAQGIQLNRLRLTDAVEKRNQEIADRRRAEEGERLWTSTVQKHIDPDTGKPDYDSAIDELYQSAPDIAELKKQELVKHRTAAIDLRRKELDADKLETANDVETIKRMTTQEAFLSLRQKLSPLGQQMVGDAYNPEHLSQLIAAGEKDVSNTEQMRALLDKDLRGFMLHSLLQANDPEQVQDISEGLDALYGPKQAKMFRAAIGDPLTPEGKARIQELLAQGQKPENAPPAGSFEAFSSETDPAKRAKILADRKAYMQADDRPPQSGGGTAGSSSDVKAVAQAIVNGQQPPEMTGMYRNTLALKAELARQGYDLTKATEDWKATQKHLSTLNGAQQTRLRQAVAFTADSLDVIDDLNAKWQGGRFPMLNKAQLSAAKNGLLGPQAQTIATQLDSQIADLVSELGTVYKGGNSSTDESLRLAAENLKSNWSQKQLQDAVSLVRRNLRIRQNSIMNTGVVANEGNAYAPKTGGSEPSGSGWVFDPVTGKLVKKGGE